MRRTLIAVGGLLLGQLAIVSLEASSADAQVSFSTSREALDQGISAYRSGNYAIAIPALEFAKEQDAFPARYYLSRIYSDNNSRHTDHAKAFALLREFVVRHADTDPADYRRAPTVASALTRLARYVRDGVATIGVEADVDRAVEYFRHSATFFRDEDAQFELAKLRLTGDGLRRSVPSALHWLGVLSRKGHPGAQAFLADLYWRGKYTERNRIQALILITLAQENAPVEDRVWIEDIHQNIFCGATHGTRKAVSGMVATWRSKYGRSSAADELDDLPQLNASPVRTCANGETVRPVEATAVLEEPSASQRQRGSAAPGGKRPRIQYGTMGGNPFRSINEIKR